MKQQYFVVIVFLLFAKQMLYSQEDGVVSFALPVRNSLKFNRYIINPTFSFVREQNTYISLYNKRQWIQFENAPQTYLFSYSGRFRENEAIAFGVFQQNYGMLTTFGAVANYAHNVQLQSDSNLTFGVNLGVYKSGLNESKVITNYPDPSLENIPSNALITVNPGINYGTAFLDFGLSVNNLVLYNINTSKIVEDDPEKSIEAHIMHTGYIDANGFFDRSKFSGLLKTEFKKDKTIVSGLAMLNIPIGVWAQAGYNSLYGISGGIGLNITQNISFEYNYETGTGDLSNFGASHEIVLAYKFKSKNNSYVDDEEGSVIPAADTRRTAYTPPKLTPEEKAKKEQQAAEVKVRRAAVAQAKLDAAAKAKADALAKPKPTTDSKPKTDAVAQAKLAADAKAKADALAKAKLAADAKVKADAKAKADALAQAKLAADAKAKADALAKSKPTSVSKPKTDAVAQAKLDADAKAKADSLAKAKLAADAKAKADALAQAKLAADAKAKADALAKAKLAADAKAKADALAKSKPTTVSKPKTDAVAQAKLDADAKAKADALAQEKLAADAKAKADALAQAKLADDAKAKADALAQAKLAADAKAKSDALAQAKLAADAKAKADALAQEKLAADAKAKADALAQAKLAADAKAKADALAQEKLAADAKAKADALAQEKLAADAKAKADALAQEKLAADAKAKADALAQAKLAADAKAKLDADAKAKADALAKAAVAPKDDIAKSMDNIAVSLENAKKTQQQLLTNLNATVSAKQKDLQDMKEENDLSEKGIFKEPKPFKSTAGESKALETLNLQIAEVNKIQNDKIKELEGLYNQRIKKVSDKNETLNQYYLKTIEALKNEQSQAVQSNKDLVSSLEQIKIATEIEKKRRIKKAAFVNEGDRFSQDKATLERIKETTPYSATLLKPADFDYGEEQANMQILKSIKNVNSGYYLVVAVHSDVAKRDAFLTKTVAAGQTNINFFYDVNTSRYFIYYDKFDNIEEAKKALQSKGSTPYNGKMSIAKIEN
ncbi:type IX secretion system membrane protein, PorP/SprF family [Flavobacterium fluvii]|uniref:Type IX secretion system membrane protein, PorP/SprF family n=1 Tax=Flavobacterium fluvii TaxID=468056 RepID=A0A1M5EWY8_9FLAO|nr:type IX secretion system membrane protein PorP/SprF [Flavobacterium fluvii]SHF83755.1 type IX secretion system membrane protein, PorP/SprF family [Flavobacterium fluvii]